MKILIAGFNGKENSAKILLDNLKKENNKDILYLENDFKTSERQIENKMLETHYDYVLKAKHRKYLFRNYSYFRKYKI